MTDLTQKAMLVSLHISCWTARKHDKQVSREVDEKYGGKDAGRFNKVLASKEALKSIQQVVGSSRTFYLEQTLPWGERGERLLPSKNYSHFSSQMRIYQQDFDDAVRNFVSDYQNVIWEARQRLGGLFHKEDYPDPSEIRKKFSFRTSIIPVPISEDFRVNLGQEEVDAIKKDLKERIEASHALVNEELWQRLYGVVSHMVERLSDPDTIFRDSLLGNIIKITELLPRLNINDDPHLDAMRKKIVEDLCKYSPAQLRNDKRLRREAVHSAQDVLDAMAGYVEAAA
jgi:hypothetical protein